LAHVEAIAHLERGLALLGSLPETPTRDASEIELQLALGVSSITVRGMSSPSVPQAYGRARELAERRGDERQLFQAIYGMWQHMGNTGRIVSARPLSDRLLQVAERRTDNGLSLQAHHSAWTTFWIGGEPARAHAHSDQGRRLYDPEQHQLHRHIYGGHDPGVCARMTGGHTEWLLGYPDKALTSMTESLALSEQIAHPFSRELALENAGIMHLYRGEPELALSTLAIAEALRAEQRVSGVITPLILKGAAQIAQGALADAIVSIREGLGTLGALGWRPYALCLLAQGLMQQGNHAEALAALSEGLERIEATGERVWEVELHRVSGLVLLAQNQLDEGQAMLDQAIRVARQQQAKSLELRATTSLARLWGEQGRRAAARDLLAPVYGWFTEGFDTPDLKEAKALLAELA
jgi:predicted ATPase